MRRRAKAIVRLGRRKARHAVEKILGVDCLSSGYLTPQIHQNLRKINEVRKDMRP